MRKFIHMLFKKARALFPGLQDKIFLDSACVSLIPSTAQQEIVKFLEMATFCPFRDASEHHIAMDKWRYQTVEEARKLFNVNPDKVALIESTTHGLNIAANCIPFGPGDEVLIVDTEFLQVAIPFAKLQERGLLKIVPIATPDNFQLDMSAIKQAITPKTKAICITSVQWCTGCRLPMQELGRYCQQKGIWLIVDGVHEAGALDVDLTERYCDFYITGGHKWLNSPFGCGIMVMSERALHLEPSGYGYLGLKEPEGGWGAYFKDPNQSPYRQFTFEKVAKSFEIGGTSNYPGAIGLAESLKIVNQIGSKIVEKRILELASLLQEELLRMNYKVLTPRENTSKSGITIFQISESLEENQRVLKNLLDEKIFISMRYTSGKGGLRVSTHYFNDENDLNKLCRALS